MEYLMHIPASHSALDSPGKRHGDDSLVLSWPKAVPGLPWYFAFELVLCITLPEISPGENQKGPVQP